MQLQHWDVVDHNNFGELRNILSSLHDINLDTCKVFLTFRWTHDLWRR